MDQNDKNNKNRRGNRNSNLLGAGKLVAWALALTLIFYCTNSYMGTAGKQASNINIKYSDFIAMMEGKQVEDVTVDLSEGLLYIVPKDGYVYTAENGTAYTKSTDQDGKAVYAFTDADGKEHTAALKLFTVKMESNDTLVERMHEAGKTDYDTKYEPQMSPLLLFAINFILPFVFIMLMFSLVMRIMAKKGGMGGMGGIGGVGKANAKVYMEKQTGVTFADVAGQDEAKESLTEIIDFLHNPKKYTDIGAKLPKGALLVGPPGTGKTLLAKAVAGEANVPFFSISGSDFVEMFVGVGASRVRDLFKEAAKVAPCIVFIDEIDTIGKSRDSGRFGGNDEREQTPNQLLAEMDGFDPTKGIILLAATNRPEVLDQALLRPGRFDRRIIVDRPNLAGRLATLQVHTRNIRLAEDVNLRKIAIATAGTVGADLANLVNEAALRAVRLGRKAVNQEDLLAAFELVIAGAEKKGSVLSEFEKKLVAYPEVGHAIVAYRQKHAEPVSKITIVPHTQGALGYTLHLPEEDKHLHTRDELLAQITVSMGGRVAEELVLHTMTNGAAQDIQDATGIARNMVAMFGMSDEFGMMALASRRSQYLDGGYGIDCAQDTAAAMDRAVRDLIDACYKKAVEILSHSREDMDKVVEYLLEKETITGAEMVAILEGRDPALADNFPDPDGKGTAGPPAEPVSAPIPLSGGEPQPPDGGGMEFGPEGKPKE